MNVQVATTNALKHTPLSVDLCWIESLTKYDQKLIEWPNYVEMRHNR